MSNKNKNKGAKSNVQAPKKTENVQKPATATTAAKPAATKPAAPAAPPTSAPTVEIPTVEIPTVTIPTSVKAMEKMQTRDFTQLADVILRRYQENPIEGTPAALTQMYVGANGLVDLFIAEAAARSIMDGNNVVIKSLPDDRKEGIIKALACSGITITDPKLLEAPIGENTPGVTVDTVAKEQHQKDVENEKKSEKADTKDPQTEKALAASLQKLFIEDKKQNLPILGVCHCVAALNDYDRKHAKDDAEKKAIAGRSYKDTLTRLFSIMQSNLLLFSIGNMIARMITETGNPVSAFYFVQQASYVKDKTGKTKGYLLNDAQVATLTQMFVSLMLANFDEHIKEELTKLDPNKEDDVITIKRLKDSLEKHVEIINNISKCPKSSIDDIKDYSDEIKDIDPKSLSSDEEKSAYDRKKTLNQAYCGIRSLCNFDGVVEKDRPGVIRDHMIYILNLFRPFDDQLSLDGKYLQTTVEIKEEKAEEKTDDTSKK